MMKERFKILNVEELVCFLGLTLLMPQTKKLKLQEFWSKDSLIQTPVFGQIGTFMFYAFFSSTKMICWQVMTLSTKYDHFWTISRTSSKLLFTLSKIFALTKVFCCIKDVFITNSTSPPNAVGFE
ncbi:hypothetical protein HHI36_011873 [Cryptolaemus montrouzieri]|uniref:PiggyBac transposable element-derived protein domain-containing protein n=1 Tax=Cryptolaemus montrouzieri TaxID=559131 RepID=A0ABD2NCL0_9CUCU